MQIYRYNHVSDRVAFSGFENEKNANDKLGIRLHTNWLAIFILKFLNKIITFQDQYGKDVHVNRGSLVDWSKRHEIEIKDTSENTEIYSKVHEFFMDRMMKRGDDAEKRVAELEKELQALRNPDPKEIQADIAVLNGQLEEAEKEKREIEAKLSAVTQGIAALKDQLEEKGKANEVILSVLYAVVAKPESVLDNLHSILDVVTQEVASLQEKHEDANQAKQMQETLQMQVQLHETIRRKEQIIKELSDMIERLRQELDQREREFACLISDFNTLRR